MTDKSKKEWPELFYPEFKITLYLLHRLVQMMGKLKLLAPFEPHWGNVALWPTAQGLTTGPIPYKSDFFSVSLNLLTHQCTFKHSSGKNTSFQVMSGSIKQLFQTFTESLHQLNLNIEINPFPQEIPNAISFLEDETNLYYDPIQATAWWQALMSSYRVLERYHARFNGISPSVGFMWGTFDLRDARYLNVPVDTHKLGFIERNAMDVKQIEAGWWAGNEIYPRPAYYSFAYPKPNGIENSKIEPKEASWNTQLGEFILDYEVVRQSSDPESMLLEFFNSAYKLGATFSDWDPALINPGKPK